MLGREDARGLLAHGDLDGLLDGLLLQWPGRRQDLHGHSFDDDLLAFLWIAQLAEVLVDRGKVDERAWRRDVREDVEIVRLERFGVVDESERAPDGVATDEARSLQLVEPLEHALDRRTCRIDAHAFTCTGERGRGRATCIRTDLQSDAEAPAQLGEALARVSGLVAA